MRSSADGRRSTSDSRRRSRPRMAGLSDRGFVRGAFPLVVSRGMTGGVTRGLIGAAFFAGAVILGRAFGGVLARAFGRAVGRVRVLAFTGLLRAFARATAWRRLAAGRAAFFVVLGFAFGGFAPRAFALARLAGLTRFVAIFLAFGRALAAGLAGRLAAFFDVFLRDFFRDGAAFRVGFLAMVRDLLCG